jgi:serine protease
MRKVPSLVGKATGPRRFALSTIGRPEYNEHRLVVHFNLSRLGNANIADVERAHGAAGAATYSQSSTDVVRIVTLGNGVDVESARAGFASDARVASVDRVRLRYPLSTSSGPVYPNDPFFTDGQQWYLDVIDAVDAWGYGLGSASVPIAVIDTGSDPNQTEVAPAVTKAETIVGGTVNTSGAVDTDGHGTFVSGIADAQTNNDAGFTGIAYGASLQEYKVFSNGTSPTADSSDVAEAIRLAVANGAKVILTALGGTPDAGPDPLERDAVAFALSSGATVIAGSGDEGLGALDYPAAYDGVISVGASAINDAGTPGTPYGQGNTEFVPPYSNSGPQLGLVAPGGYPSGSGDTDGVHWIVNAYTTQPYAGDPACVSGTIAANCAILDYGTTPAAAEVAGTAALMLSLAPSLTSTQIAGILYESADDIADPNEGHGRLNVHRAMAIVANDPAPLPAAVNPSFVQFVAFAYDNSGAAGAAPHILDVTYPKGVPVSSTGTFRIADIPTAANGTYKIGVWADVNGDGIFDAGDYFGSTTAKCSATTVCSGANAIKVGIVPASFTLP